LIGAIVVEGVTNGSLAESVPCGYFITFGIGLRRTG
jgi:hypothetical protein